MEFEKRAKRIEALEAIKNKALSMAQEGADSLDVRNFVIDAKKELAYELPDQEAFDKAMKATLAYKAKKGS
jgi:acyl carrier protein